MHRLPFLSDHPCRPVVFLLGLALSAGIGLLFADVHAEGATRKGEARRQVAPAPQSIPPDKEDAAAAAKAPRGPAAGLPNDAADEDTPPPFNLPAASRKRVRECSDKWQSMKMSDEVGDGIWRDFATRCLAAKNGPFEK